MHVGACKGKMEYELACTYAQGAVQESHLVCWYALPDTCIQPYPVDFAWGGGGSINVAQLPVFIAPQL